MTTSAPSISLAHRPSVRASHSTTRQGADRGVRLSTHTSWPSPLIARDRTVPTCPEPPGMTILISRRNPLRERPRGKHTLARYAAYPVDRRIPFHLTGRVD